MERNQVIWLSVVAHLLRAEDFLCRKEIKAQPLNRIIALIPSLQCAHPCVPLFFSSKTNPSLHLMPRKSFREKHFQLRRDRRFVISLRALRLIAELSKLMNPRTCSLRVLPLFQRINPQVIQSAQQRRLPAQKKSLSVEVKRILITNVITPHRKCNRIPLSEQ